MWWRLLYKLLGHRVMVSVPNLRAEFFLQAHRLCLQRD